MARRNLGLMLEAIYDHICGLDQDDRSVIALTDETPAVHVSAETDEFNARALRAEMRDVPYPMRRQIRGPHHDRVTIELFEEREPVVHVSEKNLELNRRALLQKRDPIDQE